MPSKLTRATWLEHWMWWVRIFLKHLESRKVGALDHETKGHYREVGGMPAEEWTLQRGYDWHPMGSTHDSCGFQCSDPTWSTCELEWRPSWGLQGRAFLQLWAEMVIDHVAPRMVTSLTGWPNVPGLEDVVLWASPLVIKFNACHFSSIGPAGGWGWRVCGRSHSDDGTEGTVSDWSPWFMQF